MSTNAAMLTLSLVSRIGICGDSPDWLQRWERICLRCIGHRTTERRVMTTLNPTFLLAALLCSCVTHERGSLDRLADHSRIILL